MKQSYDLNTNKTLSTDIECFEDLSKFYITLEKIIFHIDEENLENSVEKTIELFDSNFPYSFNLTICNFVYISFCITHNTNYIYFKYLKSIQTKEEEELNQSYPKIMDMFIEYMSRKKSQESYYLIEKMIELNLINVKNTRIYIFQTRLIAHYKTEEENKHLNFDNLFEETFFENYEELSKNDWELHKKYIKEGHNPNEIAKIIRNDEIEKLQEIATQTNFNFNQTIEPSLYERCSFINEEDVTLIDYAAFFSSIKCFKYLLMNGSNVLNTGKYAVAGGNLEIIHLCEQNHSSFEYAYKTAIQFHRYDIFQYLYENKISQNPNLEKLGKISVSFYNYEIFLYLRKEGMKIMIIILLSNQ